MPLWRRYGFVYPDEAIPPWGAIVWVFTSSIQVVLSRALWYGLLVSDFTDRTPLRLDKAGGNKRLTNKRSYQPGGV